MIDYKPPRKKRSKARFLSPTGYLVLLVAAILLVGGGLAVRHIWTTAHKPLPEPISDRAMLKQAQETERNL